MWRKLGRFLLLGLRLVPGWVWQAILVAIVGVVVGFYTWVATLPTYVVLLAAVWAVAGATMTVQGLTWLHDRYALWRLVRRVGGIIADGRQRREDWARARIAGSPENWAGPAARLEEWRTAMHVALLDDPRVGSYRDGLTVVEPDRISVPLATLEAMLADLERRRL